MLAINTGVTLAPLIGIATLTGMVWLFRNAYRVERAKRQRQRASQAAAFRSQLGLSSDGCSRQPQRHEQAVEGGLTGRPRPS